MVSSRRAAATAPGRELRRPPVRPALRRERTTKRRRPTRAYARAAGRRRTRRWPAPDYGSTTAARARRGRRCAARPRPTEVTGPVFGDDAASAPLDHDLTRQHDGEPVGQRIVATGRVLDADGRPIPTPLVEIWQANASGRYRHARRPAGPVPLDPNFTGGGRAAHRRRRHVPLRHDPARRLPVGQPPQRLAPGPHPLLGLRPSVLPAPRHADVLPRRPAVLPGPDPNAVPDAAARPAAGVALRPRP